MKKFMFLLVLFSCMSLVFASTGWYNDFLLINGEAAPDNYYWIGSDPSYGSQFDSHDFGSVTNLTIEGCDLRYWSDTQDRVGGAFYWRINEGSATEVIWTQSYLGGNDYQGSLSGLGINVLEGLAPGQSYTLQIWAKSWDSGGGQGDSWLNNSGANYVASFSIPEAPTSICLTSYIVAMKSGCVEMAWTTASETENSHFKIYRDGEMIGTVEGHGTCTDPHDYAFTDAAVQPGAHAYAIADVTYGGVEVMHDAVTVEIGEAMTDANFVLRKAYPNPFNPDVRLDYAIANTAVVDLGVYNMLGEKVANLYSGMQEAGERHTIWNAAGFPSGIYFVRLYTGDMVQTQKIVLMK